MLTFSDSFISAAVARGFSKSAAEQLLRISEALERADDDPNFRTSFETKLAQSFADNKINQLVGGVGNAARRAAPAAAAFAASNPLTAPFAGPIARWSTPSTYAPKANTPGTPAPTSQQTGVQPPATPAADKSLMQPPPSPAAPPRAEIAAGPVAGPPPAAPQKPAVQQPPDIVEPPQAPPPPAVATTAAPAPDHSALFNDMSTRFGAPGVRGSGVPSGQQTSVHGRGRPTGIYRNGQQLRDLDDAQANALANRYREEYAIRDERTKLDNELRTRMPAPQSQTTYRPARMNQRAPQLPGSARPSWQQPATNVNVAPDLDAEHARVLGELNL